MKIPAWKKGVLFAAIFNFGMAAAALAEETKTQKETPKETAAAEEAPAGDEMVEEAALAKQREILEKIHAAEMRRLQARRTLGIERDRDDLVKEAEEMMTAADARHAAALAKLEGETEEE